LLLLIAGVIAVWWRWNGALFNTRYGNFHNDADRMEAQWMFPRLLATHGDDFSTTNTDFNSHKAKVGWKNSMPYFFAPFMNRPRSCGLAHCCDRVPSCGLSLVALLNVHVLHFLGPRPPFSAAAAQR
jgi:hypothetical protein